MQFKLWRREIDNKEITVRGGAKGAKVGLVASMQNVELIKLLY